jgi:hypothetical protein
MLTVPNITSRPLARNNIPILSTNSPKMEWFIMYKALPLAKILASLESVLRNSIDGKK